VNGAKRDFWVRSPGYTATLPTGLKDSPDQMIPHFDTFDELERKHLIKVMDSVDGSKKKAGEILGVTTKNIYDRLRRNGLFERYSKK
jgi:transcriptional regulator with GAF, ATPase, and Fis domain